MFCGRSFLDPARTDAYTTTSPGALGDSGVWLMEPSGI
jgi:hypothetical protein